MQVFRNDFVLYKVGLFRTNTHPLKQTHTHTQNIRKHLRNNPFFDPFRAIKEKALPNQLSTFQRPTNSFPFPYIGKILQSKNLTSTGCL